MPSGWSGMADFYMADEAAGLMKPLISREIME